MRRRARIMAGAAVLVSVGLHAGGLIALAPPGPPDPPDSLGGAAQLAMLGSGFEDAAAGVITGTTTAEPAETVTPVAAPQPVTSPPAPGVASAPSVAPAQPVTPPRATPPATPATQAQSVTAAVLPEAEPVAPVAVAPPDRAASAPVETLAAIAPPPVQTPAPDTLRPRARPAPQAQAAPQAEAAPLGNADRSVRRGDSDGQPQGRAAATAQGSEGQSASDGRAAAEYPQLVNRQIARLRRPATRFSGAAVIAFTIGGNGGLSALSVARSSGNADFDRLALAHVQRAAPFPPPPAGAQRSFNITVQGR